MILTPTWLPAEVLAALLFAIFGALPIAMLALSVSIQRRSVTARHARADA